MQYSCITIIDDAQGPHVPLCPGCIAADRHDVDPDDWMYGDVSCACCGATEDAPSVLYVEDHAGARHKVKRITRESDPEMPRGAWIDYADDGSIIVDCYGIDDWSQDDIAVSIRTAEEARR